ncbi:MAG: TPM domain-containing protein [Candidatus Sericytochromatia bacterium]
MFIFKTALFFLLLMAPETAWLASASAQTVSQQAPAERVTDLSETLSSEYLAQIDQQLERYPFPVRVLYLTDTEGLNLGNYAAQQFQRWHLPENSMLMVVAVDRRKMGVHAGSELKAQLREQVQDQELPLPTPDPNASADPTLPLDPSSEFDHLELIPQAIEQVTDSLQTQSEENRDAPQPENSGTPESSVSVQQENALRGRKYAFNWQEWIWLLVLLGLSLLLALAVLGFRFWRRWQTTQELVNRFSLQGQVVYEQLEQVYESLEKIMPDFHGYLGFTEEQLKLFVKSMHKLQESYESLFDHFESEIAHLSQKDTREDAIDFFRDLEMRLQEGQQLYDQALTVLKNLKDVRQTNQQQFEQAESRRQNFAQELSEMRQLHPALKLTRIQQQYQRALSELQRFEKQNPRDPLGVEKSLKDWRKHIAKVEQESRSLPHLWQQFHGDLRSRIAALRSRFAQRGGSPAQETQINELERLHRSLLQAIEQGDLAQLSRFNDSFTRKLQELEAQL